MDYLKASVNKNACIGCGICIDMCPSVFEMDPHGLAEATLSTIDPSLGATVKEAAKQCPTHAITVS